MDRQQILIELEQIIRDVLDAPELPVTAATTAADVPGWDSFNHINILLASEARFGIKLKTAEFGTVTDVGAFADLVERKLAQRPS